MAIKKISDLLYKKKEISSLYFALGAMIICYFVGLIVGVNIVHCEFDKSSMVINNIGDCQKSCEFYALDNITFSLGGIYYTDWFYCVNIENANMSDVKFRENHELCHNFVNEDYDHFCK